MAKEITVQEAAKLCGVVTQTILNRIWGKSKRLRIVARKIGDGRTSSYLIDIDKNKKALLPPQKSGRIKK